MYFLLMKSHFLNLGDGTFTYKNSFKNSVGCSEFDSHALRAIKPYP